MIELTLDQAQAVDQTEMLPVVVHPKTREEFVLIPRARYEAMQKWIAPLKRSWDNSADDELLKKP